VKNTEQDYWNTIKSIATNARKKYPNPDDDERGVYCDDDERSEYIWESIEASTIWQQTRMTRTFYTMLQDVNDQLLKG
jgi:hypothetical protein